MLCTLAREHKDNGGLALRMLVPSHCASVTRLQDRRGSLGRSCHKRAAMREVSPSGLERECDVRQGLVLMRSQMSGQVLAGTLERRGCSCGQHQELLIRGCAVRDPRGSLLNYYVAPGTPDAQPPHPRPP